MKAWTKIGTAQNENGHEYGVWSNEDEDGRTIYKVNRAPIIPQARAGYYSLSAHLGLMGLRQYTSV